MKLLYRNKNHNNGEFDSRKNKIRLEEIEKLGYKLKTAVLNDTQDFKIDHDKFPRLINLANGRIQVVPSIKTRRQGKVFENIENFIKYYNE